ncbi:MAG TPA: carboxymuconolactone decarboxylase family protein [Spirochaetota bacterium]
MTSCGSLEKNDSRSRGHAASIHLIEECEATENVRKIYDDIKRTLGIDFVPNMYKAMANNPEYLDISWNKIRSVMGQEGKLGRKTKDLIALTVSIMSGTEYCIQVYNNAVRHNGLDDEAMIELYNVIDIYSGLNRLNTGLQLQSDEKPWNGCGA